MGVYRCDSQIQAIVKGIMFRSSHAGVLSVPMTSSISSWILFCTVSGSSAQCNRFHMIALAGLSPALMKVRVTPMAPSTEITIKQHTQGWANHRVNEWCKIRYFCRDLRIYPTNPDGERGISSPAFPALGVGERLDGGGGSQLKRKHGELTKADVYLGNRWIRKQKMGKPQHWEPIFRFDALVRTRKETGGSTKWLSGFLRRFAVTVRDE